MTKLDSTTLHERARRVIRAGERAPFEALARDLLAFQALHVEPVGRLLRARGVAPETTPLDEIPGVPCDVFRLRRVAAHPASEDVRVFRTSGTTLGARGAHFFRDLSTYELAATTFARTSFLDGVSPSKILALASPCAEVPDSSLGFMIELFARDLAIPIEHFVSLERGVDVGALATSVARARDAGAPVLFLGTAFAFVHALDAPGAPDLRLPQGSRAMLTGGFKGRSREVKEDELRAMLVDRLGIPPIDVVGEYGMTELSSQLWQIRGSAAGQIRGSAAGEIRGSGAGEIRGSAAAERSGCAAADRVRYAWPPWMRVVPVDPETLAPVGPGDVGIGRILDLANVDSAMVIQTNDLVRLHADGLELLGRAPGATPRGCSIAIEEITGG